MISRVSFVGLLGALAFTACATAVIRPDSRDARWASEKWPGTTVEDLARGRELFVMRCAGCHNLPEPVVKAPEEWAAIVEEMAPGARLAPGDRDLVTRYLGAASTRLREGRPAPGAPLAHLGSGK